MRRIPSVLLVVGLASTAYPQVSMVDNGGGFQRVGQRSSVTIGGDGFPLIAYENAGSNSIRLAHCLTLDCTQSELSSPFPAGEIFHGYGAGVATGANGYGVLAWQQWGVGLRLASCSNARCSTVTAKTLDPFTYDPGMPAQRAAVVVRQDGRPFIAYSYPPTEDLRIADCADATCSSATLRIVDATGRTGSSPSVTLRSAGTPLISYHDHGNGDLRLADCTDVDCSSWTLSTVDSTGDVGSLSSIAFGSTAGWSVAYQAGSSVKYLNGSYSRVIATGTLSYSGMSLRFGKSGLPVLALFGPSSVRVVRCTDASCVSFESHDLPTLGPVAGDFSMAVGSDGLPLIPFYGEPPSGLYVAHCQDEACQYVTSPPPAPPADYYTVTPCRLADTRWVAGPSGGPALGGKTRRDFPVTGECGIPGTATAVAVNLTVANPTGIGNLALFPAGGTWPGTSAINFSAGQTRANNAIIAVGLNGMITVACTMGGLPNENQTHFILDVSGYFE